MRDWRVLGTLLVWWRVSREALLRHLPRLIGRQRRTERRHKHASIRSNMHTYRRVWMYDTWEGRGMKKAEDSIGQTHLTEKEIEKELACYT